MNFSELWRTARIVYREVSFQSIFSLRLGAGLPQKGKTDIQQQIKHAMTSTLISKILTSLFIGIFVIMVLFPLTVNLGSSAPPRELAIVGSVSAYLAIVLFLIIIMGLQVSTALISSKISEILNPLPVTKQDISKIIFLCFVRIFDIPLLTAIIAFPLAYSLVSSSILGGLICLAGVGITEVFALTLTIGLSKFFYYRIAGGGGRSKWKTIMRFIFIFMWLLPSFGIYFIINFGVEIVQSFASLTQLLSSTLQILTAIYPFSYGFLVSLTTFSHTTDYTSLSIVIASSLGYLVLAGYCLKWIINIARKIGFGGIVSTAREVVKDTFIRPQTAWLGIIRKDLRIASRSPSFASLFFLPAIQAAVLAMSFSALGEARLITTLGVLTGLSIIILLLPPILFSIEGLASAYTRSLPLTGRTLIFSKALLSTFTYLVSLMVLLAVTLYLKRDFIYILTFGVIHTFSVSAAIILELAILARKFWKEGAVIGNLYARLSTYISILLPGLVIASMPIIIAFTTFLIASDWVIPVFLAAASTEFTIIALIVFSKNK